MDGKEINGQTIAVSYYEKKNTYIFNNKQD
jgi:hypothetical protein